MEKIEFPSQIDTVKEKLEKRKRAYGKLAIISLAQENKKAPYIEDNPNIIPADE